MSTTMHDDLGVAAAQVERFQRRISVNSRAECLSNLAQLESDDPGCGEISVLRGYLLSKFADANIKQRHDAISDVLTIFAQLQAGMVKDLESIAGAIEGAVSRRESENAKIYRRRHSRQRERVAALGRASMLLHNEASELLRQMQNE